jgi:hypothetical protein
MADNLKKRGKQDRSRVSQQPHEQAYQQRKRTAAKPIQTRRTQQRAK